MYAFTFHRPETLRQAVGLLTKNADAKILAGGHTLLPTMKLRLAGPPQLIDLSLIEGLSGIELKGRSLQIGAMARHAEVHDSAVVQEAIPVLAKLAGMIGDPAVRHMGTIGGSIAFADPGLDYPPAIVAAGAEVEIASATGRRRLPARDFFLDWYTTALEPGEIVVAVVLPRPGVGGAAYVKHARVSGDYATAAAAVCLEAGGAVRAVIGACGPTPIADPEADALLTSDRSDAAVARAGALLEARADPLDDVRGSAEYRRLLIPRLLLRAVRGAEASARKTA